MDDLAKIRAKLYLVLFLLAIASIVTGFFAFVLWNNDRMISAAVCGYWALYGLWKFTACLRK